MMKPLICLSLILFPLISIVEGGSLGGWNPIKDLSDPNLQALAKFAVDEHNKQSKSNLVFVKIVQGKEQVISGKKYDFIITVRNGNGAAKNYEAVVVERVWEHYRSLESFISVVEGGIPGGWNPIKNLSNPKIEALAKFAIDEHNKLSKANLVFVKIVQGKEQVISGMNYDFIIAAKNGNGAAKNYEAVVVERAWEHYKSLESFISVVEGGNFGGWNPIKNLSNPNIEALAKFAIAEHNKQSKANLVFEKIVQGREQVISGKRYDFIIAAKNGNGAAKNYEAVVVERVWEHYRNLESFIYVVESGNLGGWNPIKNLSNPNIEALAKFAIDKHNKQSKANLVFVKIVQGKQQVISGMKYDFIIAAKNENGAIKNYEAVVVERLWEHYRSLESFISIVDGGNLGGWKPIKNLSNPNIEALAKFAIDEYNKQSKANLVFVKIVQGKEQVISGKRYDFIIAAKNGNGEAKNFEAVVVERVWEHYRNLESFISVVGGGSLGGWNPIKNLSNPNIVELAKFAIDAHNKQSKANLMFMKIVKGKQQVISGMKYDFIIAAKNENGAIKNYEAVVVEKSWEHYRSLESFKAV